MSKLTNIILGWKGLLFGNESYESEIVKRSKICSKCPINVDNFCSKKLEGCGCYIPAKVYCIECKCPKDKWKKLTE